MKQLILLMITFMLLGCGTTSSVKVDTRAPEKISFTFQDDRPADKRLARNDTRPEALGQYFGDDNVSPSAPDLLKAWLQNNLGMELTGKTVTLNDFMISVYDPSVYSGQNVDQRGLGVAASSVPGGFVAAPLAGLLIDGITRSNSDKEVKIMIKGSVDRKDFSVILSDSYEGRVTEANIRKTLLAALDKAVIEVKRTLVGGV